MKTLHDNLIESLKKNRHNLHIGRCYVKHLQDDTQLYSYENDELLIAVKGVHTKDEVLNYAYSLITK